jgi:hypothetical protein
MNKKIYVPEKFRVGMLNTTLEGNKIESLQEHIESKGFDVHYIEESDDVTELLNLRLEVMLLRNLVKVCVQQELIDFTDSLLDTVKVP